MGTPQRTSPSPVRAATRAALDQVRKTAVEGGNVFDALMDAVRNCSLGQLSEALFEVGGAYRRNM